MSLLLQCQGMSHWIFLRHGESRANRERWLSGHVDVELTERGREQAREAGRQLAAIPIARAWSSDLRRAYETARIALSGRGVPLAADPALRERRLGQWNRRSLDALRASGEVETLLSWEGRPPGGESLRDLAARVLPWLAARPDSDRPRLIVAHGGLIRTLLGLVDGQPPEVLSRRRIANAEPIERIVPAARWVELAARWGAR